MRIRISAFKGQLPRVADALLDPSFASYAMDCALEDGSLRPLHGNANVTTFPGARETFVYWSGAWVSFTAAVDAVPGPIADDRLYITDGIQAKVRAGGTDYPLALAPPVTPPILTLGGTLDSDLAQEITYAYTHVTSLDEESAPSPLAYRLLWSPGCTVTLSGLAAPQIGRGINRSRIYRSQTSALGVTDLYFVAEIPVAIAQYTHDLATAPLGEVLPSADYDEPPAVMRGIITMPNGIMAAFNGRELLFSEPYRPHAWPSKYRRTIDYPIIGLAAFGTTLAVMTTGTPYIGQGAHPDDMVLERVEDGLPCVSARGIVDLGYAAAYPSTDGLVLLSASGPARMVSAGLFTRKQWRDLAPATFAAGAVEGRYVFSHLPEGQVARRVGIIDLTGDAPFYVGASDAFSQMHYEPALAELCGLSTNGKTVTRWNDPAEPRRTAIWRSRTFSFPGPQNFGVLLVETEGARGAAAVAVPPSEDPASPVSITTRVYADGALVASCTDFDTPCRLPSGFMARNWIVEVETNTAIAAITMATAIEELTGD